MARTRTTTRGKKRDIIEALSKNQKASYAQIAGQFGVTAKYVAELARKNNLQRNASFMDGFQSRAIVDMDAEHVSGSPVLVGAGRIDPDSAEVTGTPAYTPGDSSTYVGNAVWGDDLVDPADIHNNAGGSMYLAEGSDSLNLADFDAEYHDRLTELDRMHALALQELSAPGGIKSVEQYAEDGDPYARVVDYAEDIAADMRRQWTRGAAASERRRVKDQIDAFKDWSERIMDEYIDAYDTHQNISR